MDINLFMYTINQNANPVGVHRNSTVNNIPVLRLTEGETVEVWREQERDGLALLVRQFRKICQSTQAFYTADTFVNSCQHKNICHEFLSFAVVFGFCLI